MAGFINRSKYATILTEDIPGSNSQMRFISDKHVFQLTGTNSDTTTLSNVVGYNANQTVLSMVNNWVGIGTTVPLQLFNKLDVYDSGPILTANATSVGIRTDRSTNEMALTVYGSAHITDNVGIGTFYPKEKVQVYGNIMAFSFKASGGDYSEWELLAPEESTPLPGNLIGFNTEGYVTQKWSQSKSFGVVSHKPSMVGNQAVSYTHLNLSGQPGQSVYASEGPNDSIVFSLDSTPFPIGTIRRALAPMYELIVRI